MYETDIEKGVFQGQVQGHLDIAPIELKLGESNPKDRAGMKLISRRVSSKVRFKVICLFLLGWLQT